MGKIIVLIGASGSGKSTIGNKLEYEYGITPLVSYTSRKKRDGEIDGIDYYFLSKETAKNYSLISVEQTIYDGNIYGLTSEEIDFKRANSKDVYFISDKHGASEMKKFYKDDVVVFWLKVSPYTMFKRMLKRGDTFKNACKRVIHAYKKGEFNPPEEAYILNANKYVDISEIYGIINK